MYNPAPVDLDFYVETPKPEHPGSASTGYACVFTDTDELQRSGDAVYLRRVGVFGLAEYLMEYKAEYSHNFSHHPAHMLGVYIKLSDEDIADFHIEPTVVTEKPDRFGGGLHQFAPAQIVGTPRIGFADFRTADPFDMTASMVEREFNVVRQTVYDAMDNGYIQSKRIGRTRLVRRDEVAARWEAREGLPPRS